MLDRALPSKQQARLFGDLPVGDMGVFPPTRYQGSKHKLTGWIDRHTKDIEFDSALDAFGGAGCVAYMFKKNGKRVFYNDALKFNHHIGLALIENSSISLGDEDIEFILKEHQGVRYPAFIFDTFRDIYFTDKENKWLDVIVSNISALKSKYKKAIALYALFQSCIIKRPYNLFHRKNLSIRTAEVERSFGNKKTWDTPFEDHFRKFANQANNAIFDNGRKNKAHHADVFGLEVKADLVYIDTPYISARGVGVNYFNFYHFLEGLVSYDRWAGLIDEKSRHKQIKSEKNEWCDRRKIHGAFEKLFEKFKDSVLLVSYRDDGIPTIPELVEMLKKHKKDVVVDRLDYKYALSKSASKEALIVAR